MKILVVGPPLNTVGGIQNYLELLMNYMKNQGHLINYFTQPMKFKKSYIFYLLFFLQYIKFKACLRENKPDIIHQNFSLIWASVLRDLIFLNISKMKKCRTVLFIHGWRWEFFNGMKKSNLVKKFFIKNFNKADKIIVLSKEFKNALVELGIDEEKIFVTTTMVETAKYQTTRKSFDEPFYVLFCANMKKEKGPFAVLDSVPFVLNKFSNTKFVFIGSGKDLNELKQKTKNMNLSANVNFTGYLSLDEKQIFFKQSHIFVFPTEHAEGFPTVILEAMASGMPLITTAVAGLKDALENGKQGLIIDSNPPEPKEISQKIIQLLENKNYMKKISENNTVEAKEKYDVKIICGKIEEIYLTML
jgi:glycosyltransferase involved in cell wall biosynthesis